MLTYAMPPDHSGAAKQAITLASKLAEEGVNIFFLTQGSSKASLAVRQVARFDVIRVYKHALLWKILAPARFFWELYRHRNTFSILHVHGVGYLGKIAVIFGRIFRKKVILKMTMFTQDDALSIKRGRYGRINFFFFSLASRYIAITESFRQSCAAAGVPLSKVSLIPNGVDTDRFRPLSDANKRQLRRRFGLPLNRTVLVYAGLIRPEKGIDLLVDTVVALGKRRRDIVLLLLGPVEEWLPDTEKAYATQVLERMKQPELRDLVHFVGNRENVEEYLQAADIFVSASRREGFPNVLLEAMATGLPPVVIDIPGVHENILQNAVDGIVVRERDADAFAGKIATVIDDRALRFSISEAAIRKVNSRYSAKKVARDYLALYGDLIGHVPESMLQSKHEE